jgi:hypothetical protein
MSIVVRVLAVEGGGKGQPVPLAGLPFGMRILLTFLVLTGGI